MLLLTSTNDIIRLVTGSAGDIDVHASWMDLASGVVTAGRTNTVAIITATNTTIVAAPAASTTRNVKTLHIANVHASVSNTVTVQHTADGTNFVDLESVTLAPGERLSYVEGVGMRVFDVLGREKIQTVPAATTQTTMLTDQVTGAVDVYILGSNFPVGGRLKAGSVIRWTMTITKGTIGAAAPIWQIRFGTAGAIADTSRISMTGAAQTAAADTARIEVSATVRTPGASGIVQGTMGGDHLLAATGFSAGGFAQQAISAAFDLTVANLQVGLSVNPGTSAAWTFKTCNVEAFNLAA